MADYMLSCDWGTSSFRLHLVELPRLTIIYQLSSEQGIGTLFKQWSDVDKSIHKSRYVEILCQAIEEISQATGISLASVPVVISGMASSSIGLEELPYASLPFPISGEKMVIKEMERQPSMSNPVILFSGLCSTTDVMRGEETQLLGLIQVAHITENKASQLYILPGTHSKHVVVQKEKIVDFKTYMTGEVFATLSNHTILKDSLIPTPLTRHEDYEQYFKEGVIYAQTQSLLESLFMIRTNFLFQKLSKEANYYFFSGLMIGEELKSLRHFKGEIVLGGGANLRELYMLALDQLQISYTYVDAEVLELAALQGQWKVYQHWQQLHMKKPS